MSVTIAVVRDHDHKGEAWKVLVNYIQRGITFHSIGVANREATDISENEIYDHLILAKKEV